jgi:hypothetical protein
VALSASEVAQYGYNAGWRGNDLLLAVAHAYIESSFDPSVTSPTGCAGLWRLCPPPAGAYDPQTNANAAYAKWKAAGSSFDRDWTPFNGGSKNPRWNEGWKLAQQAAASIGAGTGTAASSSSSRATTVSGSGLLGGKQVDPWGIGQGIADGAGFMGAALRGGMAQGVASGQVLVGLLLLGAGVGVLAWLFFTRTDTGREIGRGAKMAAMAVAAAPK